MVKLRKFSIRVIKNNEENAIVEEKEFVGINVDDVIAKAIQAGYTIACKKIDIKESVESKKPLIYRRHISKKEIQAFFFDFGTYLSSIEIRKAIGIMKRKKYSYAVKELINDLEKGIELGEGVFHTINSKKWKKFFNGNWRELIKIGEQTNNLGAVLIDLSNEISDSMVITRKIILVLIYPSLVFIVGLIAFYILLVITLPKILELAGGVILPPITQNLVDISDFVVKNGTIMGGFMFLVIISLFISSKTNTGKYIIDYIKINIPIVSYVFKNRIEMQISKILEQTGRSGMTPDSQIKLLEKGVSNVIYQKIFKEGFKDVIQGKGLDVIFNNEKYFSVDIHGMIEIGVLSQDLGIKMGIYYIIIKKKLEDSISLFNTLFSVIILPILGVMVGYFALGIVALLQAITESAM